MQQETRLVGGRCFTLAQNLDSFLYAERNLRPSVWADAFKLLHMVRINETSIASIRDERIAHDKGSHI